MFAVDFLKLKTIFYFKFEKKISKLNRNHDEK
jgi:hypothetical protein